MRLLVLFTLLCAGLHAHAQSQSPLWLHVDYTYNSLTYKETSLKETAALAGVKGEVGFNLFGILGVSVAGEYADGHTDYDGATFTSTSVKQVTNGYLGDLRALGHITYGSAVLSAGLAQRYSFSSLPTSYRRRTSYDYTPIQLTYFIAPFYVRYEQDLWGSGRNRSYMSDVNASEHDVDFKLGSGTGSGAELGLYLPGALANAHIFVRYHKWNVKQSNTQNDGVYNLAVPDNNTTEFVGGVGLAF